MSPFDHAHARQFHAGAMCLGAARMPGHLYRVSWYPGAIDPVSTSVDAIESWVYGELWNVSNLDLLNQIDHYEECSLHDPKPHEYARVERLVQLLWQEQWQLAWVYLYQLDPYSLDLIPDGRFTLNKIKP